MVAAAEHVGKGIHAARPSSASAPGSPQNRSLGACLVARLTVVRLDQKRRAPAPDARLRLVEDALAAPIEEWHRTVLDGEHGNDIGLARQQ